MATPKSEKEINFLLKTQSFCVRTERSAAQVLEKLYSLGVRGEEADAVLANLQADGFQDDTRFVKAFVADRTRLAGWGRSKVRQALIQVHRIPTKTVDKVMRDTLDIDAYMHRLRRFIRPEMPAEGDFEPEALEKLKNSLLNKGYLVEEVNQAIEDVKAEPRR